MAGENSLNRLRRAFAIPDSVLIRTGTALKIGEAKIKQTEQKYEISEGPAQDKELYMGALGTPVYTNIEFLSEMYETKTKGRFIETPRLKYDAVLITVTQTKNIVMTAIEGCDGTVKEYIGMGDYQVQVNGIITGANGVRPMDEILALKKMLDAPVPIPVASDYLNSLGIHYIVVESYELGQEAGGYSYQSFSISCLSDYPQELRLTNV